MNILEGKLKLSRKNCEIFSRKLKSLCFRLSEFDTFRSKAFWSFFVAIWWSLRWLRTDEPITPIFEWGNKECPGISLRGHTRKTGSFVDITMRYLILGKPLGTLSRLAGVALLRLAAIWCGVKDDSPLFDQPKLFHQICGQIPPADDLPL